MGLLDWLLRRKKPETEMPTMGQKTAERQIQPQESEDTQTTKDLKELPTIAKQVSEQREVVIEGKEGAAPSPKDYVNEGVEVYQKGDYQDALSKFKVATELDPTMAAAWSNMGCALGQLGDCDGALEAFATALDIDPENQQAKEGKELCLKMAKQVSEQREVVIEGKEGAAPSSQAEVEPAEVRVPVEATRIEKTTTQEEAQPEMSAKEYVSEGVEVYQKGDYQDALSKFKVATELDPTMAAAWSNMGCALGQLGDCDGALEAFATALDIDPENQQAKEGKELCLKMAKHNIST